jgi:sterol desaturase/sphingolipid hydroxylase (fatty acid hydroxylase superfamily)
VLIAISTLPWAVLVGILNLFGAALPGIPFLATFAATCVIYYIGYEGTHLLMHKPRFGWLERSRPFQFIKRHHSIHHVRMNRNFNVLLPLADLVLGTLVLEMPPAEATPARAREVARQHSRFGRRAAKAAARLSKESDR